VRPFPETEADTTPGYTGLRMLRRSGGLAIAAVCAAVVSSCGSSPPAPTTASQVIARVGSDTITLGQFNVRYQSAYTSIVQGGGGHRSAAAVTVLRARILGGLILDTVIRQEATKLGLAVPYCDVVVTEKFAHHVLVASGFTKRMSTVVLPSTSQLADHFARVRGAL